MIARRMCEVIENSRLASGVYYMKLDYMKLGVERNERAFDRPGQFAAVQVDGFYLRRPFAVCEIWDDSFSIIYKVVGGGTGSLSRVERGEKLDVITGLGNGYDTSKARRPLLIGGGTGVPPLVALAHDFVSRGVTPTVLLGFNERSDAFCLDRFEAMGAKLHIAYFSDGQLVTDLIQESLYGADEYFACGPMPMLRKVHATLRISGQLSLESRMACGVGLCRGCTCETASGGVTICSHGPVFRREELPWI